VKKIFHIIILTALTFALITSRSILTLAQTSPIELDTGWSFSIDGKVNNPTTMTVADLADMPSIDVYGNIVCSGDFIVGGTWTGVPVTTLLAQAGADMSANTITFHAVDGYSVNITMGDAVINGLIIAYKLDGQPLTEILRLVLPDTAGPLWIKSITEITVTNASLQYTEPSPTASPTPSPTIFQIPTPPPTQYVTPKPTNSPTPDPTISMPTNTSLPTQAPTSSPAITAQQQTYPSSASNANIATEFGFVLGFFGVFCMLVIGLVYFRRRKR
jgi:DMSO/TMAO reductase YedYZ molybdopterin-dependent catalytic subunit